MKGELEVDLVEIFELGLRCEEGSVGGTVLACLAGLVGRDVIRERAQVVMLPAASLTAE